MKNGGARRWVIQRSEPLGGTAAAWRASSGTGASHRSCEKLSQERGQPREQREPKESRREMRICYL